MWKLFSRLRTRAVDEPDPFEGRATVPVRIRCDEQLTREEFYREGGERSGRAWWWLREARGGFVPIVLPRGYEPLDCVIRLPPGRYVLGVGRDVRQIRMKFEVPEKERK